MLLWASSLCTLGLAQDSTTFVAGFELINNACVVMSLIKPDLPFFLKSFQVLKLRNYWYYEQFKILANAAITSRMQSTSLDSFQVCRPDCRLFDFYQITVINMGCSTIIWHCAFALIQNVIVSLLLRARSYLYLKEVTWAHVGTVLLAWKIGPLQYLCIYAVFLQYLCSVYALFMYVCINRSSIKLEQMSIARNFPGILHIKGRGRLKQTDLFCNHNAQ